MSHQEINLLVHTNKEGIVNLNIPTGIIDGDIQLKVSFEIMEQEILPAQKSQVRVPGIDEGRFVVPDDFDDPLPADLLEAFEGKD